MRFEAIVHAAVRALALAALWLGTACAAPALALDVALERLPAARTLADGDAIVMGRHDGEFERVAQPEPLMGPDRSNGRWWRIVPAARWSGDEAPLLALYAPYANRVTVRAPPDYRAVVRTIRDRDLDPRRSRHALVFPLPADLAPQTPVYVFVDAGRRFPMRVAIEHPAAFAAGDLAHVRWLTALLTTLAVMAVVVGFFAIVLRELDFALLAGALAFQLLFLLLVTGEAYALPALRELDMAGVKALWVARALGCACLYAFLARLLLLDRHLPRLGRALRFASFAFVALAAAAFLPVEWTRAWLPALGNVLLFGAALAVLAGALVAWRRGVRSARFVVIAWLPTLVLDMAREAQLLGPGVLVPPNEYAAPLAMAFASLLFALALADRLLAVRRERDVARRAALRDPLTGVLNRAALAERLHTAVDAATAEGRALAVLFLDLDRFKQINDAHGHAVGDACLLAVVDAIAVELRQGDDVARYGGEEFVVLLPGASAAIAATVAERIRTRVRERCAEVSGRPVALTVSIGVAALGPAVSDADALLARADAALYAAKAGGRDRVELRAA